MRSRLIAFGTRIAFLLILPIRLLRLRRTMRQPENAPDVFLARGRRSETRTRVACIGDSITHGVISANYVAMLQRRLADDYELINAGINGNRAVDVLQRLDAIIACQPDRVTLLIGTNDVNKTFDDEKANPSPAAQTMQSALDAYRETVAQIIDRLQAETHARIALLEIAPLGEDLASAKNQRIDAYNQVLEALAAQKGVTLLPLNRRLSALCIAKDASTREEVDLSRRAIRQHYLLGKSWNAISAANHLSVLTDGIHLNDTAAAIVADLIADFLENDASVEVTTLK